jgi:hypothetical protein
MARFTVFQNSKEGDPLLAEAIGQDNAAVARAPASRFGGGGSIHCGFSS